MTAMIVTVNGTAEPDPFGPGFAGDVGRAFAYNEWDALAANVAGVRYDTGVYWQPIGYPAATFPMGPSVEAGRAEVNRQIALHEQDGICPPGNPLFLSGYSQGAIVVGEVWAKDILDPAGAHHHRLPDVAAGGLILFGDPLRSPGIANGNKVAGIPAPGKLDGQTTGGIAGPACLTPEQTPDFVLSCALDGDLYAAAPVGDDPWHHEPEVGQIETHIYNIVQFSSPLSLLGIAQDVVELFEVPLTTAIAIVQAIVNGLTFFAAGNHAPHWQYGPFVPHMVAWIRQRVAQAAAA